MSYVVPANGSGLPTSDTVIIGTDVSPGRATIVSANSPRKWDIRQGYAMSGATLVPSGDDLAKVQVLFELWDATGYAAWQVFAAKYFDKAVRFNPGTTTPRALGIYHPVLAAPPLRITEVVVEDCTQLSQDEDGLWSCTVSFIQYRKPKLALAKPAAAIPAAQATQPTAQDQVDRDLQNKLATLQTLGGQLAQ